MNKYAVGLLFCYAFILTCADIYYFSGKLILKSADGFGRDSILQRPVYKDHVEEYTLLNMKEAKTGVTVFAGDSITRRFNLCEYFPGKRLINRGIFQDTTLGLLNRIETTLNNLKIKKLFIMIGYNDLRYRSNEDISKNISQILSSVNADTVYVQSVLPVGKDKIVLNPRIKSLNLKIQKLCKKEGCFYIDLYQYFVDNTGRLKPEYSRDGVHPNGKGYKIWSAHIQKYL